MEKTCNLYKTFANIKWNTTSLLICATPFALIFVLIHMSVFMFGYGSGAIVSNHETCAMIGKKFLEDGGSVIDAAIGTMICEGVKLPNRAGIGGGFTALLLMNGHVESLTATPVVPKNFPPGFIYSNSTIVTDAKAAGVPGELRGYWDLHQKYGILPWKTLFEPTIKICENGIPVTEWIEMDIERSSFFMHRSKTMRELYRVLQVEKKNNTFKLLTLAQTLRKVAHYGADIFYKGEIGTKLVEDIQSEGGYLTMNDLNSYRTVWNSDPIAFQLPNKLKVFTTPLPSMGPAVALTMNIIKPLKKDKSSHLFWHMTIEAMKHAFGYASRLADIQYEKDKNITRDVEEAYEKMTNMEFAKQIRGRIKTDKVFHDSHYYGAKSLPPDHHGTANICILSPKGNAIVISSSLMWDTKTFFWSRKTGIVLNNLIRNFLPPQYSKVSNLIGSYVRPGARAMSPHCPCIAVNRLYGNAHFIAGASGSASIPSQVIASLINYCLFHRNAYHAVNSAYFVPDIFSDLVYVANGISSEFDYQKGVLKYLSRVGHKLKRETSSNPYRIRSCIGCSNKNPDMYFTSREHGSGVLVEPDRTLNVFAVMIIIVIALVAVSILTYEIIKS